MSENSILVVDDDVEIFTTVRPVIEELGYLAQHVSLGKEAYEIATRERFAFIVLDLTLPDIGGLEILRGIRGVFRDAPVLILSGRGDVMDRVLGLELGADDYVVKPFSTAELRARIRTRLRNIQQTVPQAHSVQKFGDVEIDLNQRLVKARGTVVDLSVLEFDLVAHLSSRPGVPMSRADLLESVWGTTLSSYESNVNASICRIRKKIEEDPENPKHLITVWGFGYKWGSAPGGG